MPRQQVIRLAGAAVGSTGHVVPVEGMYCSPQVCLAMSACGVDRAIGACHSSCTVEFVSLFQGVFWGSPGQVLEAEVFCTPPSPVGAQGYA